MGCRRQRSGRFAFRTLLFLLCLFLLCLSVLRIWWRPYQELTTAYVGRHFFPGGTACPQLADSPAPSCFNLPIREPWAPSPCRKDAFLPLRMANPKPLVRFFPQARHILVATPTRLTYHPSYGPLSLGTSTNPSCPPIWLAPAPSAPGCAFNSPLSFRTPRHRFLPRRPRLALFQKTLPLPAQKISRSHHR